MFWEHRYDLAGDGRLHTLVVMCTESNNGSLELPKLLASLPTCRLVSRRIWRRYSILPVTIFEDGTVVQKEMSVVEPRVGDTYNLSKTRLPLEKHRSAGIDEYGGLGKTQLM